jgi:cysteine desulfurase
VIYLDNNATTRPSPGAAAAVASGMTVFWQNPSSIHRPGQDVRNRVELARKEVGSLIGARAREIIFTSGGTESIDLAIRGTLGDRGGVVVSTRIEHAAVRNLLERLESFGTATVRWAPINGSGIVDLTALPALLAGASLASIQWANNETGAIQPVAEIGGLCRDHGVPFHCDGTQWVGKEPTRDPPCDLLTFSPHKFHGPKGVGVLRVRPGTRLGPTILGTQEMGRRGGTENVPGILGAGAACREAAEWLDHPDERRRLADLRDRLERLVREGVPDAVVNGPTDRRLWNTTNIGFPRLAAEALLLLLSERGVCASAGAACSSGSLDPSPVLLAMGVPEEIAHGSVRFSLSRETTVEEIEEAARVVIASVRTLRGSSASIAGAVERRNA